MGGGLATVDSAGFALRVSRLEQLATMAGVRVRVVGEATRPQSAAAEVRPFGGPCSCNADDHCSCCIYYTEFDMTAEDGTVSTDEAWRGARDEVRDFSLHHRYDESLHYAFQVGWLTCSKSGS